MQLVENWTQLGVVHVLLGVELAQQTLGRNEDGFEVFEVRMRWTAVAFMPRSDLEVERCIVIALRCNSICHVTKFLVELPGMLALAQHKRNSECLAMLALHQVPHSFRGHRALDKCVRRSILNHQSLTFLALFFHVMHKSADEGADTSIAGRHGLDIAKAHLDAHVIVAPRVPRMTYAYAPALSRPIFLCPICWLVTVMLPDVLNHHGLCHSSKGFHTDFSDVDLQIIESIICLSVAVEVSNVLVTGGRNA